MMSDPTEEEVGEERTRVRMEMVMYLDAWRPRALPVAGRVIAGLLCGGDGICISNHRLTHLKWKREELQSNFCSFAPVILKLMYYDEVEAIL